MKHILLSLSVILAIGWLSSCKKDDPATPSATCTIIINDTLTLTADSIRYDYYGGTIPRIQAFNKDVATFTLWPGSLKTGTVSLGYQYVYWIYKTGIYTPANTAPGSLQLTNANDVLSGTFTASGNYYSGSGPATGKISATFANVRKSGM